METSFRSLVVRSSAVNVFMNVALRVGMFFQAVVFARIFLPVDLGQLSTVMLILGTSGLLTKFGGEEAIVRERESVQEMLDAAFTMSMVVAAITAGALYLIAPVIAEHLRNQQLVSPIRLMLPLMFATPLAVPSIMWVRIFRFGMARLPAAMDLATSFVVTLCLQCFLKLGVQSLFIGKVAGFVANYGGIWIMAKQRPHFRLSLGTGIRLYRFGWPVLIAGIANYIVVQGDSLVVSYFCGFEQLAYYTLAFSLPFYLREFSDVLSSSLLPTYSYIRESRERTVSAFLQTNRFLQLLIVPCSVALISFAKPVITYVYGPNWIPSIRLLKLLALAFTIQMSCGYTWGILCLAWAKVKYLMAVKLWLVLFFFAAAPMLIRRFGIMGGAYYTLASAVITVSVVRFFILYRELGDARFVRDSAMPLAASGVAALVFMPVGEYLVSGIISLGCALLGYYAFYLILIFSIDRNAWGEIRTILLEFKGWLFSRNKVGVA